MNGDFDYGESNGICVDAKILRNFVMKAKINNCAHK